MHFKKLPPVLDSKQVLQEHIKGKLKSIVPLPIAVDVLASEICENRCNKYIIKLLEDEQLLKEAILSLNAESKTKQKLGTELFICVSRLDTSLCAQITGMLLDLDILTIYSLLLDSNALEIAVERAKEEYLKFQQKSSKEYLGEEIYSLVLERHPDPKIAAQLTGMLLELDIPKLKQLLIDPIEFNNSLLVAFNATI